MILKQIPVKQIQRNPKQPRKSISGIEELADNINEIELINPISVEKKGKDKYQLICGERRWNAFIFLKRKTIPALITKASPYKMMAENLARQELNLIEKVEGSTAVLKEALGEDWKKALGHLHNKIDLEKYTPADKKAEKICKAIGIKVSVLYLSLPVLNLDKGTKKVIFNHREYFTDGVILKLARMPEKELIQTTAQEIAHRGMTSKEAYKHISNQLLDSIYGYSDKVWFKFFLNWSKSYFSVQRLLNECPDNGEVPKVKIRKFRKQLQVMNLSLQVALRHVGEN